MDKLIYKLPQILAGAMAGDPVSIALLIAAGIKIGCDALKNR